MAAEPVKGVAAILLAGGTGSRMKADRPKQFLELEGKPILQHSLDLFFSLEGVETVVSADRRHVSCVTTHLTEVSTTTDHRMLEASNRKGERP